MYVRYVLTWFLIGALIGLPSANAYSTIIYYYGDTSQTYRPGIWNNEPLKFYVNQLTVNGTDYTQLTKDAINTWSYYLKSNSGQLNHFRVDINNERPFDITITLIPEHTFLAGQTACYLQNDNLTFSKCDVWLNVSKPIMFSGEYEYIPELQFYTIALHEVGHALGLGHTLNENGKGFKDTMTAGMTENETIRPISKLDIEALLWLYGNDGWAGKNTDWIPDVYSMDKKVSIEQVQDEGFFAKGTKANYNPEIITVEKGDFVKWTNNDKSGKHCSISGTLCNVHTVVSGKASDKTWGEKFDSGVIRSGKSFTYQFNEVGEFNYFCKLHPWMSAKVVVVE